MPGAPALLFLAHRLPFPPDRGDRIRSFNILRRLSRHRPVHLAALADSDEEAARLAGLRAALGDALGEARVQVRRKSALAAGLEALASARPCSLAAFGNRRLRQWVASLLDRAPVETVYAFSGQMAQYVPADWRGRLVMDFVDMDSAKFEAYARSSRFPLRQLYSREARLLFAHELAAARRADSSCFVSEAEAALFRRRSGLDAGRVGVLENGVDLVFYDPRGDFAPLAPAERGEGPLLLFTGQMDYRPNVEAAGWFAHKVFPRIRAVRRDARFAIAGRAPTREVMKLAGEAGIRVTGEVADMRPWLAAADISVAPLRTARGIQNKVLEAMAMARPVVASPAAFEGIDAVPGRDLVVAGGAEAQADTALALLADPAAAEALGRRARERMVARYAWEKVLAPLDDLAGPARPREAA